GDGDDGRIYGQARRNIEGSLIQMRKVAAIFNLLAGVAFALAGCFVVLRCGWFLTAAPRDHYAMVAWAGLICTIGIYLVIRGLGCVRFGVVRLNDRRTSETSEL